MKYICRLYQIDTQEPLDIEIQSDMVSENERLTEVLTALNEATKEKYPPETDFELFRLFGDELERVDEGEILEALAMMH